ncbi:hypothetical protein M422DRAFT_267743 [Sphaerobolus stellatus SS14]|uniref:Uncharacterized protein n=1 Tax=Sphaerobolus stellatus (strain SS14) TaxID=990650 RepID=A0A0C9UP58_SPHS4|nr:hypothetical protein M422DRAFT_267743 [Sphaerobolus stellatus SS14]
MAIRNGVATDEGLEQRQRSDPSLPIQAKPRRFWVDLGGSSASSTVDKVRGDKGVLGVEDDAGAGGGCDDDDARDSISAVLARTCSHELLGELPCKTSAILPSTASLRVHTEVGRAPHLQPTPVLELTVAADVTWVPWLHPSQKVRAGRHGGV